MQACQSTMPSLREKTEIASMPSGRGASRSSQWRSQQAPSPHSLEKIRLMPRSPQRRHQPDGPQDPRRYGQRVADGRAEHHQCPDVLGLADGQ